MTRKVWTFFLLSLFVVFVASTAFAAKADKAAAGIDPSQVRPIENLPLAGTIEHDAWLAKNSTPGATMGFTGPEDRFVGQKIGSTWYDYQHNGSMGRNIAQGSDARIHFAWMHKFNSGGVRSIFYNSAVFSGGAWVTSEDTNGTSISGTNGGYCNIGTWNDLGVPHWHEGPTENSYSIYTGIDFGSGSGAFQTSAAPVGATCTGHTTDGDDGPGNYLWPIGAVDVGFASDPRFHAVGHESTTNTFQSFVYFQGNGNPTNWGSCGHFVDSVSDIAGIVRQDPNSDDVCIAWIKPREYGANGNQYNNDVVYVESNDGGVNWPTPGTYTNLTNHVDTDLERPYCNLTGIYTADGCLHIGWDSPGYYDADGTISIAPCKLYHWDDCNDCISLIIDADNAQTCAPGAWNRNVTKQNFSECDGKLYCTYTYFLGDSDDGTTDCSAGGWANGEIYAQASSTGGETWGPPVNLTSTPDNNCASNDCESEHWSSTIMYADSLYTFYTGDTDAGGVVQSEGAWTESPMMFMVNPCFDMAAYVDLSATPSRFYYPMNVPTNTAKDTFFVLQNAGNIAASWTHSITYASGSGWINLPVGSGTVGAGCNNSETINATFTGPSTEGLYEATININFSKGVQDVDVELYVFDEFCLPENVRLRTSANLVGVSQVSRSANQVGDAGFAWFADTTNYLFDGSLIIGNSGTGQWDFDLFHTLADEPPSNGTNPWGRLYTNDCNPVVDTSTAGSYRFMSGTGLNHDSTIAFDVAWYADWFPDTNDFYVMHVDMYAGPKFDSLPNDGAPINNLVIGYGTDWDVPSDTGSDNRGFVDAAEQTVYQQGLYAGSANDHDQRFGGTAYRGHTGDNADAAGGIVWDNPRYIYVVSGYHVDTLQNRLPGLTSWDVDIPDSSAAGDDLNCIVVVDNNATIDATNHIEFNIILWAINPHETGSGTYAQILDKAEAFICGNGISPDADYCGGGLCGSDPLVNCKPGDANGDGTANISDAVYLITYIFGGGSAPHPWSKCSGDANGDCTANISDAVYLITYIFGGGTAPVSCETFEGSCADPGIHNPGPW
jgi:hypothetical protein